MPERCDIECQLLTNDLAVIRAALARGAAGRSAHSTLTSALVLVGFSVGGYLLIFQFTRLGLDPDVRRVCIMAGWLAIPLAGALFGSALLTNLAGSRWIIPLNAVLMWIVILWTFGTCLPLGVMSLVGSVPKQSSDTVALPFPYMLAIVVVIGYLVFKVAGIHFYLGLHEFRRFNNVRKWATVGRPVEELDAIRAQITALVGHGESVEQGVLDLVQDEGDPERPGAGPKYVGLLSRNALILVSKALDDAYSVATEGFTYGMYSEQDVRVQTDTSGVKVYRLTDSSRTALRTWARVGEESLQRADASRLTGLAAFKRWQFITNQVGGQRLLIDGREADGFSSGTIEYAVSSNDGSNFAIVVRTPDGLSVIPAWGEGHTHPEIILASLTLSPDEGAVSYFARAPKTNWGLVVSERELGTFVERGTGQKGFLDVGPIFLLSRDDRNRRVLFWARSASAGWQLKVSLISRDQV